jgi:hypothetical protein
VISQTNIITFVGLVSKLCQKLIKKAVYFLLYCSSQLSFRQSVEKAVTKAEDVKIFILDHEYAR